MANIKLTLPAEPFSGQIVTFTAPCDCASVTGGIVINTKIYTVCDAMGNKVTGTGGVWCAGAQVSVVLDCENKKAYIQNGKAIPAQIGAASASEHNIMHFTSLAQIGLKDDTMTPEDVVANLHSLYTAMTSYSELYLLLHTEGNPNLWRSLYNKWSADTGKSPNYTPMHVKFVRRSYTLEVYVTMQGHLSTADFDGSEYSCMLRAGNTAEISVLSAFTVIRDPNGFVSNAGGTMVGNLSIAKGVPTIKLDHTSGYGAVMQAYNDIFSLYAMSDYAASTAGDYRKLNICDPASKPNVSDALTITDKVGSVAKAYKVIHEGNKNLITPSDIGAAASTHTHTTSDISGLEAMLSNYSKIASGSYVGTGTYGKDNPNTLTFPFTPKVVFIDGATFFQGDDSPLHLGSHTIGYSCVVTWGTDSVSWYSTTDSANSPVGSQGNGKGQTYHWVALG